MGRLKYTRLCHIAQGSVIVWTVSSQQAEGELVAARISATGVHTGQLDDLPPTHRSITLTATAIYRFVDGRIVERWCDNGPAVLRTLKSSHTASFG